MIKGHIHLDEWRSDRNLSGFKGVYLSNDGAVYNAEILLPDATTRLIGSFPRKEDAARAYALEHLKVYGPHRAAEEAEDQHMPSVNNPSVSPPAQAPRSAPLVSRVTGSAVVEAKKSILARGVTAAEDCRVDAQPGNPNENGEPKPCPSKVVPNDSATAQAAVATAEDWRPGDDRLARSTVSVSGFKGVSTRGNNRNHASFYNRRIGTFASPIEAARARRDFIAASAVAIRREHPEYTEKEVEKALKAKYQSKPEAKSAGAVAYPLRASQFQLQMSIPLQISIRFHVGHLTLQQRPRINRQRSVCWRSLVPQKALSPASPASFVKSIL